MFLLLILRALAAFVPKFDEAAGGVLERWDVLHFAAIAQNGYQYEHQFAFLPGLPTILHYLDVVPTSALVTVLSLDALRVLYELSLILLKSPELARITAVLALLPSSPVTLFLVPYTEPFFTYFSYRGMLYCARSQWPRASLAFALAACFRSNGVFLAGFILWGLLIAPLKRPDLSRIVYATLLSAPVFAPFVYHNYTGYMAYCVSDHDPLPAWCHKTIPLIYTHVQAKYWNNGLFKYWTLQQLPNILLGLPPILLIFSFGYWHLKAVLPTLLAGFRRREGAISPFASLSLTPHVLHGIFTASLLLFASHTQITLRLAASMPVVYWAAAWLWTHTDNDPASGQSQSDDSKAVVEAIETSDDDEKELMIPQEGEEHSNVHPGQSWKPETVYKYRKWAKGWVYWSAVWGSVSTVLWVAFLPPA